MTFGTAGRQGQGQTSKRSVKLYKVMMLQALVFDRIGEIHGQRVRERKVKALKHLIDVVGGLEGRGGHDDVSEAKRHLERVKASLQDLDDEAAANPENKSDGKEQQHDISIFSASVFEEEK